MRPSTPRLHLQIRSSGADGSNDDMPCVASASPLAGRYRINFIVRPKTLARTSDGDARSGNPGRFLVPERWRSGVETWGGYSISRAAPPGDRRTAQSGETSELGQWVGAAKGRNRVLGGLLLHLKRRGATEEAVCAGMRAHLSPPCGQLRVLRRYARPH